MTVHKPDRVVVKTGERGTQVTVALAVNVLGNYIPPIFVFSRVRYQDHFLRGVPLELPTDLDGCKMKNFFNFLNIVNITLIVHLSTKLLYSSHTSIKALDYC
ncbi:unnamed protein product [Psylliodes chrysocephalus]|uniref:Uncharacterized protein n=1 Tax=Psylliodes chrysocephalus TaxID=3402493 RepID=A0A9P0D9Q3_9CUCU|nr:unnamed protein product [Psylliodes chrysocephala]